MKPTFRASMAWLHTWSGLVIGWLLLAITLAGTLSVFRPEISAWMRPELHGRLTDADTATQAAIGWLTAHAAHAPAWYLEAPSPRNPFTYAVWEDGASYAQHALDPKTGAPDVLRDTLGGEFFFRFHFELQLPYPWGRLIAAVAALALVLILLTGIVAHKRIFLDFFTFRPGKGQRSWLDAHNLLGVVALPFHLMIAFTGAITLANMIMPWGLTTLYKQDFSALTHDFSPATIEREASGEAGSLTAFGPLLADAKHRFAPNGLARITVTNPSDSNAVITFNAIPSASGVGVENHTLSYDGITGKLLAEHRETRPVMGFYRFLYGLHVAYFAPYVTRWLYFLSGLSLAALICTGLQLWTSKRCHRQQGLGFKLVERLNIGMMMGTPTAFAGYFIANRVLPPFLANRAQMEVRAVFCIWAAILLFALVRRTDAAWRETLAISSLTCLTVSLIGGIPHTPIEWAVSLVSLGMAALMRYAMRYTPYRKKQS
ncbi:PepSY-associated TM helix domain-containing protein [Acetobacter indonesiensis]|uniref:PepSY-associated TM helix domain-containing protein n=1 Tax=Acetobacter indonesiensis TaxID=104101 RepID=UPI0020A2B3E6|nr:PepSY-associated TM helix domain-containing protein [Acetobacter indonesiensis]MCP1230456.1 PepSY domain-containing protein [Acetobacter indonesiensis]